MRCSGYHWDQLLKLAQDILRSNQFEESEELILDTNAFSEMEERRKLFEKPDIIWSDYEKLKRNQIPNNFGLDVITNFLTQTYIKAYQGAEAIDIGMYETFKPSAFFP